jgi:hypothetical protein
MKTTPRMEGWFFLKAKTENDTNEYKREGKQDK